MKKESYGIKKSDEQLVMEFLKVEIYEYPKFVLQDGTLNEAGELHLKALFLKVISEAIKANKKKKVAAIQITTFGNLKDYRRRLILPAENYSLSDACININMCTCGTMSCWGETTYGKVLWR